MPGLAATVGSMHVCPMCTVLVPHVGGPVSGPGIPNVLIGGKPAAVMGDLCVCVGPPDIIAQGCGTVLIGGKPAVTVGDMTAHGGIITNGEATVLIGTGKEDPSKVMSIEEIPFPKINTLDRLVRSSTIKEAIENQEKLKEEARKQTGDLGHFSLSL